MNARVFTAGCLLGAACSLMLSGCHGVPGVADSTTYGYGDECATCGVDGGNCGHARMTHEQRRGPAYDRPFPLGQVTDAFWETQQTNAEASDFVFYDHEFVGETAELTEGGKRHLLQVALRLPHVPFPIIVEQSADNARPRLDRQRRETIVDELTRLGVEQIDPRVGVAPALARGITAMEGESAYYRTLDSNGFETGGRRYSGRGAVWW